MCSTCLIRDGGGLRLDRHPTAETSPRLIARREARSSSWLLEHHRARDKKWLIMPIERPGTFQVIRQDLTPRPPACGDEAAWR
jgi:hypothetical protein